MTSTVFDLWEVCISEQLEDLRSQLSIPIAALPIESGKFLSEQTDLIDFLFSSMESLKPFTFDTTELRHTLVFRIYLTKRYANDPVEKTAINWVVTRILALMDDFLMPACLSRMTFVRSQLFAPVNGSWYNEMSFTFTSSSEVLRNAPNS